ncbi:galactoside 2-alpha-L-fucosyltransferase 2-like [Mizuhopecten yessoensis]|uniref:L-Fucosyltransferase n=1 Tax=Mizuhopecten yessoensis TaxID=6573 RepID=A0A210PIU6_MIZYE|nr:galactoside 2-alpha-L-fucosyltransferase 2-like [Mizuhopecten yessoensis]OWF36405.1 Galactoside 2-alpha-L-fucosyltransferase 2 [Mizuhopecten yessoensis]
MPAIKWFPFWRHIPANSKFTVLITCGVVVIVVFTLKLFSELHFAVQRSSARGPSCAEIQQGHDRLMASVEFSGGLGNIMFQYAFLYVTSRAHGYEMVVPSTKELDILKEAFEIDTSSFEKTDWEKDLTARCFDVIEDEWDCAYDPKLVEKSRKNVHYKGYFQSWKYLVTYEDDLRQIFRFRPSILNDAASVLQKTIASRLNSLNSTDVRPVLVGIHVRRGDYLDEKEFVDFGYNIADYGYIEKAMAYFRRKYSNVLFIACSNDVKWVKAGFGTTADVFIVEGNSAATDMAILSLTNHTIMTVGTFGWWISFLTNGHTVYYKYPFRPGSLLGEQFKGNIDTHIYPNWVGLEGDNSNLMNIFTVRSP